MPGVPVKPIPDVVAGAHLVVLAVPDDALADLVAGLSATGTFTPGQLVLHTSGAHGISVFEAAADSDIVPLAIHPAMTFTGTALDLERLHDCCFGVTTVDLARPLAEALVIEMGGDPVWIAEEDRVTYHAALAHGVEPPRHPRRPVDAAARRGRGRGPRARPRAAALGRAGQHPAAG